MKNILIALAVVSGFSQAYAVEVNCLRGSRCNQYECGRGGCKIVEEQYIDNSETEIEVEIDDTTKIYTDETHVDVRSGGRAQIQERNYYR